VPFDLQKPEMARKAEDSERSGEQLSELQTVWRRAQSPANPSPAKIPDNREKYRELKPAGWPYRVYPLVKTILTGFQPEIVTGP
jgi:hypothetical protein